MIWSLGNPHQNKQGDTPEPFSEWSLGLKILCGFTGFTLSNFIEPGISSPLNSMSSLDHEDYKTLRQEMSWWFWLEFFLLSNFSFRKELWVWCPGWWAQHREWPRHWELGKFMNPSTWFFSMGNAWFFSLGNACSLWSLLRKVINIT